MKSKREQILKLCEFGEKDFSKNHPGDWTPYTFDQMAKVANDKQKPIITALLDRVEQLEGALEQVIKDSICMCYSDDEPQAYKNPCVHCQRRLALEQELTATSPLDKLLEG